MVLSQQMYTGQEPGILIKDIFPHTKHESHTAKEVDIYHSQDWNCIKLSAGLKGKDS
jgi:hypothetical protein